MAEDPGLWFIDGKVRSGTYRARVWAAFQKLVDRFYDKRFAVEARHRKEIAALDAEFDSLQAQKPYTPWVGRADEGAVAAFVDSAVAQLTCQKDYARRARCQSLLRNVRRSCGRMKFIKENKISKEWRAMKITVDFENGMQVTLKPENIQLVDNGGKETVLTFNTDHTLVPIMFFKSILASPAELKAREEARAKLPKEESVASVVQASLAAEQALDELTAQRNKRKAVIANSPKTE